MNEPRYIVAEISKNWYAGDLGSGKIVLSGEFERVLEYNTDRGYKLHSWRLDRQVIPPGVGPLAINETIIAVFEKEVDASADHS